MAKPKRWLRCKHKFTVSVNATPAVQRWLNVQWTGSPTVPWGEYAKPEHRKAAEAIHQNVEAELDIAITKSGEFVPIVMRVLGKKYVMVEST